MCSVFKSNRTKVVPSKRTRYCDKAQKPARLFIINGRREKLSLLECVKPSNKLIEILSQPHYLPTQPSYTWPPKIGRSGDDAGGGGGSNNMIIKRSVERYEMKDTGTVVSIRKGQCRAERSNPQAPWRVRAARAPASRAPSAMPRRMP